MSSISIAIAVAVLTFGSGLLGLYLQKELPKHHMSGGSKDMIHGTPPSAIEQKDIELSDKLIGLGVVGRFQSLPDLEARLAPSGSIIS